MSLAYMEKIFPRCSSRKIKGGGTRKKRKNNQQRMVVAEGIDPKSIKGKKIVLQW